MWDNSTYMLHAKDMQMVKSFTKNLNFFTYHSLILLKVHSPHGVKGL